jgi:hypothetical protein
MPFVFLVLASLSYSAYRRVARLPTYYQGPTASYPNRAVRYYPLLMQSIVM